MCFTCGIIVHDSRSCRKQKDEMLMICGLKLKLEKRKTSKDVKNYFKRMFEHDDEVMHIALMDRVVSKSLMSLG